MISLIFMIIFLEGGEIQFIAEQPVFNSVEECEAYAFEAIADQKALVEVGISEPHTAVFKCVNWGQDV
jgi:hypothetical protein